MEFELTREITEEIIFSMEDQSNRFLYDSREGRCLPAAEAVQEKAAEVDGERFYAIPQWDSVSGYRMMDRFVLRLRNPVAREELRSALSSGYGVFRTFKNILKSHPEIEKLWHSFKDREMRAIVLEWYNGLRDFWGLERIGAEPEETEDILSNDFTFREASAADSDGIQELLDEVASGLVCDFADEAEDGQYQGEIAEALLLLCARQGAQQQQSDQHRRVQQQDKAGFGQNFILLAETIEGDLAGCALSSTLTADGRVAHLTALAVLPDFRGLGIGKRLLLDTASRWTEQGCAWLLFDSPAVPALFLPVLRRLGFIQTGQVMALRLRKE